MPLVGDVASDDDHTDDATAVCADDATLGLDDARCAVARDEPVIHAIAGAVAHRFAKHRAHALTIFGVDVGERIGSSQRLGITEQRRIGRAVVDPPPFDVEKGDQVARVADDERNQRAGGGIARLSLAACRRLRQSQDLGHAMSAGQSTPSATRGHRLRIKSP
jgi:hypothetical protein